tara:strand:+ start:38 stop:418 length:381 start_codon:yes stop_codon:yes gene_type:complete
MDGLLDNFAKLGRYVVAIILVWLGAVGILDIGFTAVEILPLLDLEYAAEVAFAFQFIIGLGIFNSSVKRFAKPVALIYFLLVSYNFYENYAQVFTPAIPYFSEYGLVIIVEVLLIFAGNSYLRHYK